MVKLDSSLARNSAAFAKHFRPTIISSRKVLCVCSSDGRHPQGSTRLPEALDRLIELYTATGKPDEVNKWQAERSNYPEPAAESPEK